MQAAPACNCEPHYFHVHYRAEVRLTHACYECHVHTLRA